LLVACSTSTTPIIVTPTIELVQPAATTNGGFPLDIAAQTAQRFVDALNKQDYVSAFALLDENTQAQLKDAEGLKREYNAVRATTNALTVTYKLSGGLLQQDNIAQTTLVTTYKTTLIDTFDLTSTLTMTATDEWRIGWSRDVIAPGLANGALAVSRNDSPRGSIYFSDGTQIAGPAQRITLGVQRGQIKDANEEQNLLSVLSQLFQKTPDEIRAKYVDQPPNWFTPIGEIDEALLDANGAVLTQFPAISVKRGFERQVYQTKIAPHVIGFVGAITPETLAFYRERGYLGDERVGVSGVEAGAESILAGRPGVSLQLVANDQIKTLARREHVDGQDVTLTISPTLQTNVQKLIEGRRGAAVVLRTRDAAVLAMASFPTFDPTRIADGDIRGGALLNRATQGLYPPGSTFKMVTMAAGLQEGLTALDEVFLDPGFWDGYGKDFRKTCWLKSGHGQISLATGLTVSCNVVFYELGKRLEARSSFLLGDYARKFGFGEKTGVELGSEQTGLVPDPDWKKRVVGEAWTSGDAVNMAVGQGFMLVTPIQIAQMTAAIANGGKLNRAYMIASPKSLPATTAELPVTSDQLPLTQDQLSAMQKAMIGVTTNPRGTTINRFASFDYYIVDDGQIVLGRQLSAAQRKAARRLIVAGKSGTAQAPGNQLPFAWFTAYAPADDPQIAVTVLFENAGQGSAQAAPVVRQIIEAYFSLPISPTPKDALETD
jgi:penicillin-binding protein 2